ncbi:hypothetical protein HMI54_008616 [Coelomomyces lativittatus]|nr:hypothetical protein HMI56_003398 [Coelomomyces lativittatus]KAJ1502840.1 hypothetical protein HMI54_008616 [Coelomomyces lativittatus]KAJ1508413.1 hypothetical protein HMI55_000389 [Coelomomyces lativittatus]
MGITLADLFTHLPQYSPNYKLIQETFPTPSTNPLSFTNSSPQKGTVPLETSKNHSFCPHSSSSKLETKLTLTIKDFSNTIDETMVQKARKHHKHMRMSWPIHDLRLDEHVPKKKFNHEKASSTAQLSSLQPRPSFSPTCMLNKEFTDSGYPSQFFDVTCILQTIMDLCPHDGTFEYPTFEDCFSNSQGAGQLPWTFFKRTGKSHVTAAPDLPAPPPPPPTLTASLKSFNPPSCPTLNKPSKALPTSLVSLGKEPIKSSLSLDEKGILLKTSTLPILTHRSRTHSTLKSTTLLPLSYPNVFLPFSTSSRSSSPPPSLVRALRSTASPSTMFTRFSKPVYASIRSNAGSSIPSKYFSSPSLSASTTSIGSDRLTSKKDSFNLLSQLYFPQASNQVHPYLINLKALTPSRRKVVFNKKKDMSPFCRRR